MEIYNILKNKKLSPLDYDITKGYLKEDKLLVGERPELIAEKINLDGTKETTAYPSRNIEQDILIYIPYNDVQLLMNEKQELECWFETTYKEMFEKCTRKISLNIKMHDNSDPKETLDKLYIDAEKKAARIREIRKLVDKRGKKI